MPFNLHRPAPEVRERLPFTANRATCRGLLAVQSCLDTATPDAADRPAPVEKHTMREPTDTRKEIPPCGCLEPGLVGPDSCYCGVEDLLRVIRRRYSLAVLNAVLARGGARFNDLETALDGVSTSTLADTLRALTAAQLLERTDRTDQQPRTFYTITPTGEKLVHRLRNLLDDVRPE